MSFLERLVRSSTPGVANRLSEEEQLRRQVGALFGLLSQLYGPDRLVLKAGKLEALAGMRSDNLGEQVVALQKLVFEDPTLDKLPKPSEIPAILEEIEDEIADVIARRSVEEKLEKKIQERMQEKHEEYVRDIRLQVVREDNGPENPMTEKKLAHLEELEAKKLSRSALELLRPASLDQVVGQARAVKALLTKVASPFPQHVILYGPPGVGKTTAARLVLEEAKRVTQSPFAPDAPFVEVDGTVLRWDPREVTNPLLGSVHDPIYQGARRDLAETGVPEPKLGLVTEAHGGILFIDEIGELEPMLLNKLLKVLEEKRVYFDSSYYDPSDPNLPKWIRKLFEEGAPADFILIGATTRPPEEISPAIRSRCAEVFFEPLSPAEVELIVVEAAERLGVRLDESVASLIAEYTVEGRKAIGILADAYGLALYRRGTPGEPGDPVLTQAEVLEVIQIGRLAPQVQSKASAQPEVGKVFGLGVYGYVGSVVEIEAVAFAAREKGKGSLRFNETAGSMAKDSVFNAASLLRRLTGQELADFDVHVNVIGGGQIDGPSAGAAIFLAIYSAITGRPIRQDLAITGEISIRGQIKAIGGVAQKLYGAKQSGMRAVVVPEENRKDIPSDIRGIEVICADTVERVVEIMTGTGTGITGVVAI